MELEIKNVSKSFGKTKALFNVNITFSEGIYGILGQNGAGKSTLIHLITDNLKRETGKILFDGVDIKRLGKKYRSMVGYMPQQQGYYEGLTAMEFLKYMAEAKGIKGKEGNRQIKELLEIVHLDKVAHELVGKFSGGMKQRVLLAQALLGEPKILILDEPTAGLDPKERIGIRNYIAKLSKDKIILYTTHVVSDIETIANEILILNKGEVVKQGTLQRLIKDIKGKVIEISCNMEQLQQLQKQYLIGNVIQREGNIIYRVVSEQPILEGRKVSDISLEDVFLYETLKVHEKGKIHT